MKRFSIHLWAGAVLLVSSGFSPVHGSLVANPLTIFLGGLTLAGMCACEYLLQSRRRPAMAVVVGHSRN
jgi:hypothetical protein